MTKVRNWVGVGLVTVLTRSKALKNWFVSSSLMVLVKSIVFDC